jgi:hypothetical protein
MHKPLLMHVMYARLLPKLRQIEARPHSRRYKRLNIASCGPYHVPPATGPIRWQLGMACKHPVHGPQEDIQIRREPGTFWSVSLWSVIGRRVMRKLSLFAVSASAALVCAAVPGSFNWSSAKMISVDTAEARVGRPLTATSVAGVSRRVSRRQYRRAAVGAAVGAAAVGAAGPATYVGGPAPPPAPAYGPAPAAPYPPGPAVAAAVPYGAPGYGYGPGPYPDAVIVNPVTGRWCRTESNGYQFCWTP